VHQQQSYHAANYRGNQPGHDQYLRADSVNPSSGFAQNFQQQTAQYGQYRPQVQYQPQQWQQQQQQQFQQAQNPQAYHTANYRGNQPGHDQYLRADSVNPSSGFAQNFQQQTAQFAQYRPLVQYQPQQWQQQQQFQQAQNPQAYHAANYRGNQPGHDQYLRADSVNPSSGFAQNFQQQTAQYGQYRPQVQYQPQQWQQQQQFQQAQNPQAYHTANYRGNQPGHDQSLRADSQQPSNNQQFAQRSQVGFKL